MSVEHASSLFSSSKTTISGSGSAPSETTLNTQTPGVLGVKPYADPGMGFGAHVDTSSPGASVSLTMHVIGGSTNGWSLGHSGGMSSNSGIGMHSTVPVEVVPGPLSELLLELGS